MNSKALNLSAVALALVFLHGGMHQAVALNEEEQQRYYSLLNVLRCLVCQNQSLADSSADLAGDLRAEVRGMLERGLSDDEIFAYMTDRYGDYVLYEPPLKPHTYVLWFAPFVLLALILALLLWVIKRRADQS